MAYDISSISALMDQKIQQLDLITNNLANTATPGFKETHLYPLQEQEGDNAVGAVSTTLNGLIVNFAAGMFQSTGNPLDLSLQKEGLFVVQTADAQAYTRRGDFTLNKLSQLVTQSGDLVLGENGPITLDKGKIEVGDDGAVYVDENQVGKLRIVDFKDRSALKNISGGLFRNEGTADPTKVEKPGISSGFIELSNVNVVKEMAEMIDIHRSFETYQKMIQTLSEQDKLSTSRVGKIS